LWRTGLPVFHRWLIIGVRVELISIDRNAQNALPEAIRNDELEQSRSYNGYAELLSEESQVNEKAVYQYDLSRSKLGRITGKTETIAGVGQAYEYVYNDKRHLVEVKKDNQVVEAYSYDANGNRTLQTSTARGVTNQSATYNIGDQLISMGNNSYEYDADGYIAKKTTVVDPTTTEVTTYQYSSQGRLLKVVTPTKTIEYKHNALGNRVAKLVDGEVVEKYLWLDKITLLATYDKDDQLVQRFEYVLGNTPTSYTQDGNKFYIISGHLGTPRAITNETGDTLKKINYDSFANVISDSAPEVSIPFDV